MTPAVLQALVDMHVHLNDPDAAGRTPQRAKPSADPSADLAFLAGMRTA